MPLSEPDLRSSEDATTVQADTKSSALNCINNYKVGCSASAARQAAGGRRGAVVKPRTLQGPSTGSHCGWVVSPRRA